jgi:predicted DsbA family dithiol-disulfide isomerase
MTAEPARLIVYSDYLCPWCFNAAVRLRAIEDEFGDAVEISWRSFLLRPRPEPRSMEQFRVYTRSWLRPAAEADAGTFRVWSSDEGPPSHSLPPQLVAKAAATLGPEAFARMHAALWRAYFTENRDVTSRATLRQLWAETDLPAAAFDRAEGDDVVQATLAEHNEAVRAGVTGVPTVRAVGHDVAIAGALPLETYRRWVRRLRGAP